MKKNILTNLKQDIYEILDANDLNSAKTFRNELIDKKYPKTSLQTKYRKFIILYIKKLTTYPENKNIPLTNNKIENIFQKVLAKQIKRTMKIELGVLTRFMLKLNNGNINNEKEKDYTSF